MEAIIKKKIAEIETQYNVKVLFACETGSRAWGFPSPDSDFDVRMIYRHDIDWYLSLNDKKDTIEFMSEDGELDVTGWDIKKCLQLMWKSNGALLERVQSPIVYTEEKNIATLLKTYTEQCFSPVATMHHYLGLARNSFADVVGKDEIKLKKFFYALRATLACKWILDKDSVPPIVFQKMLEELDFDMSLKNTISELIVLKSGKNESYLHPSLSELNKFIEDEIKKAEHAFNNLTGRKKKEVDLDLLFQKVLKEF
jgi:predicted nucleotidyltransferase